MDEDEPPVPDDVRRVSLDTELDLEYWTNRFSVSRARLEAAVAAVGKDVDAVRAALEA